MISIRVWGLSYYRIVNRRCLVYIYGICFLCCLIVIYGSFYELNI